VRLPESVRAVEEVVGVRWPRGRIRMSKVSAGFLGFGLALLVVALVGSQVSVNGTQLGPGVSWWQRTVVVAVGVFAITWAVLASRGPVRELWTGRGFLGTPPGVPKKLIARRDLAQVIVGGLRQRPRTIALIGIGGAGKSTLAAIAITDRRTRRRFRDGVTWLEAGPAPP
jgi:hypothetical protein